MKEEDTNQEKAEIEIQGGKIITIEMVIEETVTEMQDSEVEATKKQDIIKKKAIHYILVIYRMTQVRNKSKESLKSTVKLKTLEFLTIIVGHLKDLHMLNFKIKEMLKKHLTIIKLILMDEKLD
tara:strand:- start:366 stop:737 length:372 start_codon:yes stop_codon:yes gene_type:complete